MDRYSNLSFEELHELLETLHDRYNRVEFIEADPISIPHSFERTEDKEIAGFLAATIAWGNRKAIVKSARRMVEMMDNAPFDFTMGASEEDLRPLLRYVHRTFNGQDFTDFIYRMAVSEQLTKHNESLIDKYQLILEQQDQLIIPKDILNNIYLYTFQIS